MLSASTTRLVESAATLGEPEMLRIKGADEPVPAQRLLGISERHRVGGLGRAVQRRDGVGRVALTAVEPQSGNGQC